MLQAIDIQKKFGDNEVLKGVPERGHGRACVQTARYFGAGEDAQNCSSC